MIKKLIKYALAIGLLLLLGYKSIYVEPLDKHIEANTIKQFDAVGYADKYFTALLPKADSSIVIAELLDKLKQKPDEAFDKYGNALGISSIKYFLTQGKGIITAINESSLDVQLLGSDRKIVTIATEFIYGNAIRDASGLVDLSTFTSTSDLNNVSAAVNKKIREKVLPAFKKSAMVGDSIAFTGAIELNQKFPELNHVEIVPISIHKIN